MVTAINTMIITNSSTAVYAALGSSILQCFLVASERRGIIFVWKVVLFRNSLNLLLIYGYVYVSKAETRPVKPIY